MAGILSINSNYTRDWMGDIVMGRIPGHRLESFFGSNEDIDIGSDSTIWPHSGNEWVRPAVASEFFISSSSASDVSNTFEFVALDGNYNRIITLATPNGQTPVQVPGGPFLRVNGMTNASGQLGNATLSTGDIYINSENNHTLGIPNDPSKVQGKIQMRNGVSSEFGQFGHYTVPAGETVLLYNILSWLGKNKEANINFKIAPNTLANQVVQFEVINFKQYQNASIAPLLPVRLPEFTDIHFTVTSESNNSAASFVAQMILIETNIIQSLPA